MSLDTLKRNSGLDKLLTAVQKDTAPVEKQSYVDERFWKPELDKTGNGYAVLRFLPAPDGEDLPWAKVWSHAFQGPTGQWYIENSLTTLNQKDPVSEANTVLWNTGNEADKELARKRKRKLNYYSNVLVVSDPKHPENEGKIKLFKYGKKIFDKLMEAMNPEFEDEKPLNPVDFWSGADFKLKIRKVDGYWNYDKSEFDKPNALFDGDDAKLESLWKQEFSLAEFISATNFKSYDELKERFDRVIAGSKTVGNVADLTDTEPAPVEQSVDTEESTNDDSMSYFEKLAQE